MMRLFHDRKGEEMVEAAIVLPVLILIILSMIWITLFFYRSLEAQVSMHRDLTRRSADSTKLFSIEKGSSSTQTEIHGFFRDTFGVEHSGSCYVINMAPLLRMGRTKDVLQE